MHYNALTAKRDHSIANNVMQHNDHSVAVAFAESVIGREGGDGSVQRGKV